MSSTFLRAGRSELHAHGPDASGLSRCLQVAGRFRFSCGLTLSIALLVSAWADVAGAQTGPTRPADGWHSGSKAEIVRDPIDVWSMEQIGAWGGPVNTFAREGDTGYCGSGQRLVMLDMAAPNNVVELGSVRLGSAVRDVAIKDGYAYVVTRTVVSGGGGFPEDAGRSVSGFHVVDVLDPTRPEIVWSNDPATGIHLFVGKQIELHGDFAVLCDESRKVVLVDISNPLEPVMFGTHTGIELYVENGLYVTNLANEIEVQDGLLYVVTRETNFGYLRVYDISAMDTSVLPVTPPLVGSLNFGFVRLTQQITVEGDWAYVAGLDRFDLLGDPQRAVVWAVDVSDPSAPVFAGEFDDFQHIDPTNPREIADLSVSNGRLYIADGGVNSAAPWIWDVVSGLVMLDVATDPGHPAELGRYKTHGMLFGVVADGATVYLRDWGEGLITLDTTDPLAPVRLGGLHSPAMLRDVAKHGDLLAVADLWNGLSFLDVSDPSSPTLLGVHQAPERLGVRNYGVALDGDGFAYLGAGNAGMEVVNITDPSSPTLAATVGFPSESWRAGAVTIERPGDGSKIAYLGVRTDTPLGSAVFNLDVTDPAAITQIASPVSLNGLATKFQPDGRGLIYSVGDFANSVQAVDCSTPAGLSVRTVGHPSANAMYIGLDTQRDLLYVTEIDTDRLHILDVAGAQSAISLASVPVSSPGAVVSHPLGAMVVGWVQGATNINLNRVLLYGMEDPSSPVLLASAVAPQQLASAATNLYSAAVADENTAYFVFSEDGNQERNAGLAVFGIRKTAGRGRDAVAGPRNFLESFVRGRGEADLNDDGRLDAGDVRAFFARPIERRGE